ncbi:DNA methyltransferase [Ochrobactrum soli]|uniref:site-specific DNA-methyltransferase (cytosine-N(4)-specific) n=1 Tax=Ochrobactrum soli TaxID=2448455 RepID=A0A849KWQ9_9HYPH|nr:DNA methyltransferase [[Ochrobactrum] soli]NNU61716.1 hypothetical protein [[Ochrobactrum] soli]
MNIRVDQRTPDLFGKVDEAEYVDRLPPADQISNGDIFIIRNFESRYLTHKFHKYPGKFTPEVPRWALDNYLPEKASSVVLDPFLGSGTTLVEASMLPIEGFGVDVDPLARLIAKVKTTPINVDTLRRVISTVSSDIHTSKALGEIPSISTLNHWFTPDATLELSRILGVIDSYQDDPDIYDFLLVCFSAIIRRASNADNQTMKTYVSGTHPKIPESAIALFSAVISDYGQRLEKYGKLRNPSATTTIINCGDARNLSEIWSRDSLPPVDLAITSPPYIKSVDYVYNQMAELFWIGRRWGLETQPKQNEFKKKYMGNDRPGGGRTAFSGDAELSPSIERWLSQIAGKDPKLSCVARNYFVDTVKHFDTMAKLMNVGAHYVYVVGNSTLAGIAIPTHALVVQCALQSGFALKLCFGYEIRNKHMRFPRGRNGGQVAHDWVLTFELGGGNYGERKSSNE